MQRAGVDYLSWGGVCRHNLCIVHAGRLRTRAIIAGKRKGARHVGTSL